MLANILLLQATPDPDTGASIDVPASGAGDFADIFSAAVDPSSIAPRPVDVADQLRSAGAWPVTGNGLPASGNGLPYANIGLPHTGHERSASGAPEVVGRDVALHNNQTDVLKLDAAPVESRGVEVPVHALERFVNSGSVPSPGWEGGSPAAQLGVLTPPLNQVEPSVTQAPAARVELSHAAAARSAAVSSLASDLQTVAPAARAYTAAAVQGIARLSPADGNLGPVVDSQGARPVDQATPSRVPLPEALNAIRELAAGLRPATVPAPVSTATPATSATTATAMPATAAVVAPDASASASIAPTADSSTLAAQLRHEAVRSQVKIASVKQVPTARQRMELAGAYESAGQLNNQQANADSSGLAVTRIDPAPASTAASTLATPVAAEGGDATRLSTLTTPPAEAANRGIGSQPDSIDARDAQFPQQLIRRVLQAQAQHQNVLRIQLQPLELGRVDIQLNVSGDQLNIAFAAQQGGTRELLETHLPALRQLLGDTGLQLGDVDVKHHGQEGQQRRDDLHAQHTNARDANPKVSMDLDEMASTVPRSHDGLIDAFA